MAFRTNKVPAIEERTVSGSSVSFNSAFALPLKACKVSFSATQAGSGDPSPSNPRAISGVSGLNLSANSVPVSVNFGDTYYGGEIDLLTGILTVTHVNKLLSSFVWVYDTPRARFTSGSVSQHIKKPSSNWVTADILCDIYNPKPSANTEVSSNDYIIGVSQYGTVGVRDSRFNNTDDFVNSLTTEMLVYALKTPITIQLSANELSSIIGNNTFSTDTGTLEITFADLQEKSASGAVASFNTALAMPLASCNIAVNAWQEGSGDPSPSNVRPIHGFSEVNATRAGKNLFDYDSITIDNITFPTSGGDYITRNGFIYHLPSGVYTISARGTAQTFVYMNIVSSDDSFKEQLRLSTSSPVWITRTFTLTKGDYIIIFAAGSGTPLNISSNEFMIEAGSTATPYEPYVTPTIYTIQLGQEVYGAEVDVVNGVAHVTHKVVDIGSRNLTYFEPSSPTYPYGYFRLLPTDKAYGISNMMCEYYKTSTQPVFTNDFTIIGTRTSYTCYFIDSQHTADDLVDNKAPWLNGYKLVYELYTPFDIQLTPTQIATNIGNNTIFADTGDIDLTYKDLDIAKRGNFREVFRLPS